jgi:DNA polymerase-3 subunit delta
MADAPRCLLLHGDEAFLIGEDARGFIGHWRRDLVSDFGAEAVDTSGLTAARLADAILQAPFLDPHRLVTVRNVPPGRADTLTPALQQVPDTTRLLVTVNGRLAGSSKLLKAFAKVGAVKELPRLKGRRLNEWAAARARVHGLTANYAALVVRLSPPDLGVIDAELIKLSAYAASGAPLTQDVAMQLLAGGREEDVFRLTDQLLPRPSAGAFRTARALMRGGMGATTIGYRVARHLALVLEVKTRQERGETLADLQATMREHPFVLQKAYDIAPSTATADLEQGLRALLDYEWEVKSGQADAEFGLEAALARL